MQMVSCGEESKMILEQKKLLEEIQMAIDYFKKEKKALFNKKKLKKNILRIIVGFICYGSLAYISILNGQIFWRILLVLIGIVHTTYSFINYFSLPKRELKATEYALIYFEEELIKETNLLEELNKKVKNYCEKNQDLYLENIPSNDKKMEHINSCGKLYYGCGFNYKEYILWYKLGILRERLAQKYTESELDKIERCIATDAFQEKENIIKKLTINYKKIM